MDAVRTFSTTLASFATAHTALVERMTRTDTAIAQNHAILMQIQSHLGPPPISPSVLAQATSGHPPAAPVAATHPTPFTTSLDMLAAEAADSPLASSAAPQPAQVEDDILLAAHHLGGSTSFPNFPIRAPLRTM